ncbi:iron-siderophore ABC transporter substrate-binding protein [Streptomyces sp. BE20]|uniref:iron-siderophore ABC transporter substrate-binding protein n=1 Tax=Streptomyces sp. BE20 TaxID=3002525 RepID=UPI002E79481B|nr:iron-siderophore ABC transporter substrate-binding protein [Streptomyces sp. BE20]MEE1822134.1 iron-siderophore ABC transporter substrate-binding protein [Streptomyces sp. BE20]
MPPITRRALLTALGGLGGAALCGCTTRHPSPPPVDGTAIAESATPAPVPDVVVTTATGPVTVPGAPLRVVTLDTAELDSALTLGITPVGSARPAADPSFPDYWPASRLAPIAAVGATGDPDLAAIRALRPDLILSNQSRDGGRYEALRAIAPTVLTQTTGAPWKANVQTHAQALSRQDAAAAFAASYQRHVNQVVTALGNARTGGRKVSLVRFVEGGGIRLYGKQSFPGSVLTDAQVGRPDAQNVDQGDMEIPADQLAKADGDLLLYATYGDPDRAGTTAALASPAWQALGAVRAHRAFPVDDQLWFQGIGYTGANYVLTELQHFLGA